MAIGGDRRNNDGATATEAAWAVDALVATATAEGGREIRYVSAEKFGEIMPKIFEQHHDLLRRLAQ